MQPPRPTRTSAAARRLAPPRPHRAALPPPRWGRALPLSAPLRPPSTPRRGRPGRFREGDVRRPAPSRRAPAVRLPAGRKAAPGAAAAVETAGNGEGDRQHPRRAQRKWRLRKPRLAPAARRRGGGALARPRTARGSRL